MSRHPDFVPHGVIPAVLLPFHEDLSIDEPNFRAHLRDVGSVPLIVGGLILLAMPHVNGAGLQVVLLVLGPGLCGAIYVVCPPMLGEFTPVQQRGAVIGIYSAIYTFAGILAPWVMGAVIKHAATPLEGYMTGFTINAVIMIVAGLLGLLLLWPNSERARLLAQAPQPKFA